jgi:ferritin-like metal-binding protein YciE
MVEGATHEDLKASFQEHLEETEEHLARLEQIGSILGIALTGMTCKAMRGLVEEEAEWMNEDATPAVRDAGLICAAQRVEHYEIASYGTAKCLAETLGHDDIAAILDETLSEEKGADQKLSELAEATVNAEAMETPPPGS